MDYLPAENTTSEQPQHHCGMMELPTEMRIRIYEFALQHILDEVHDAAPVDKELSHAVKKPRGDPDGVPFYTGALALIHTNRTIRAESLDTLASRMLAHIARLEAEIHNDDNNVVLKKVRQRRRSPSLDFETVQALLIMLLEERKKIDKLQNCATQVKYICWTMGWTKGG